MNERGLRYVSDLGTVPLAASGMRTDTTGLHGWRIPYKLGYRGISGARDTAREIKVDVAYTSAEACDAARSVFRADVLRGVPGKIECGDWWASAYVVADEIDDQRMPVTAKLTVVLVDGTWRREHRLHVPMPSPSHGGGGLDYPFDYAYDFSMPSSPWYADASELFESAVSIRIYGPASSPAVVIGGNSYQVMRDVANGEVVETDGLRKAVELITADGERINIAADAVRGRGVGSGSYIFQRLPRGRSRIESDGSFAFDAIWYDEDGEPPWSRR